MMSSQQTGGPRTEALDSPEAAVEQDGAEWLKEDQQLPRRPRRRLMAPIPVALLAVLLIAGGFIAGVEVEKGQANPTGGRSAAGAGAFASRAGGAATGRAGAGRTSGSTSGGSAAAGGTAGGSGFVGAGGGVTAGEVSYLQGSTLYVENPQGDTIKVNTSAASKITKTVATKVSSIHPGETVVVLGEPGSNGSISATSVNMGASATPGARRVSGGATTGSAASGSEPALFGRGG
jgi:hypothetical protein